jgi:ADP-ribose pyrophosphatase
MSQQPPAPAVDVLEKITVFQGYFRIDAYRLRHGLFDGGWSAEMRREVFERGHAAAALLYDPDVRAFVMCEQFRVGAYAAGADPWQIEIVAGIIEDGETPDDVCRREAEEEAGRTITDLWPIQRYLASPGATSESIYLYLARVSAENAGGIFGLLSEDEHIRVSVMDEAQLKSLLDAGKLTNAATLIAAQWFFLNREQVLAKWQTKA